METRRIGPGRGNHLFTGPATSSIYAVRAAKGVPSSAHGPIDYHCRGPCYPTREWLLSADYPPDSENMMSITGAWGVAPVAWGRARTCPAALCGTAGGLIGGAGSRQQATSDHALHQSRPSAPSGVRTAGCMQHHAAALVREVPSSFASERSEIPRNGRVCM